MIVLNFIVFGFYYAWNMGLSSTRLLIDILRPSMPLYPGIIEIPVSLTNNRQYMAFFNLVTMTPGTLSIVYSKDYKSLFVHSLYLKEEEKVIEGIGKLERRIKQIFK